MSFDLRVLVIALSSFAMGSFAASACVPWLWRRLRSRTPAGRANALLRVRVMPLIFAVASLALAVLSFLEFEPRRPDEPMGVVLLALAALGAVLLAAGLARLAWLFVSTARLERAWMADAAPATVDGTDVPAFSVPSSFPIVAVTGLRRPRLIIARSVLAACTPDELRAIVAHECGHVARRDNLARAVMALSPDLLAWLPISTRLAHAWHEAAEEAADDHAALLGDRGRLWLAEALIRVARLVPAGSTQLVVPASALYRGENLDRRVRRLLEPPAEVLPPPSIWWRAAGAGAILASGALALHAVHELLEAAVTFLP
ncbi:MAG TPA: M48 family metalloprotease [Vicinamibacterales bacterium]|nr:M48 family metalloprotease [Vicinamibacterales bacterium]